MTKRNDQALTTDIYDNPKQLPDHSIQKAFAKQPKSALSSLYVNEGQTNHPLKGRRQRGGHGYTRELSRAEVKYLAHVIKTMFDQKMPIYFGTIRATDGLSVVNQKRVLSRRIAHIGQSVKRRGSTFHCLTVYERPRRRPKLHAHVLVVVPSKTVLFAINRLSDGEVIRFKRANPEVVHYLLKERQTSKPDFIRSKREPGDLIPGRRYSLTIDLKATVPPDLVKPKKRQTPRTRARDLSLKSL